MFGDLYDSNEAVLAECSNGVFQISQQGLENKMFVGSLTTSMINMQARGGLKFSFASVSPRDEFFSSSVFLLNFGFLRDPNEQLVTENNFRCVVHEESETTVSWKWKKMIFSDLSAVQLVPKSGFASPDQFQFVVKCFGGAAPRDGASKNSPLAVKWVDYALDAALGVEVQTAAQTVAFPAGVLIQQAPQLDTL